VTKLSKAERLEAELRALMEEAHASDDMLRYRHIRKYVDPQGTTDFRSYRPELLEYFADMRRTVRRAAGISRSQAKYTSKWWAGSYLDSLLGDLMIFRDKKLRHPRWAEYLLFIFLPEDEREAVAGDLTEEYRTEIVPRFGPVAAKVWFVKQVFSSIWPILRSRLFKLTGIAALGRMLH
jgi:hypothetical protein